MAIRLNLGCGPKKKQKEGYINIDKKEWVKPDQVVDFELAKLPFDTNSVDEIYTSHLLEHIENFIPFMEEIYRVCKPNAKVEIHAPHGLTEEGIADPTHVRFLCPHTFDYFDKSTRYFLYSFKCNFKVIKKVKRAAHFYVELKTIK